MSDVHAEVHAKPGHLEIIFHHDLETPLQFLIELLHSVFNKQVADALRLTEAIRKDGKASCGSYPRDIAGELLEAARQQVRASNYPLRITSRAVRGDDELLDLRCKLCGELDAENQLSLKGTAALLCDDCMAEVARNLPDVVSNKQFAYACDALSWHFAGIPQDQLAATSRQFPGHMRADVQAAVDRLFSVSPIRFFGIHEEHRYETLTISTLTRDGRNAAAIAPAQYHEVDVGESAPVKCLDNGLWLCATEALRYAVVLSAYREPGREPGTRIEIAVPAGAAGAEFVQRCFSELESAVNAARCYRGKVLSLESSTDYRGSSKGILVHKLPAVQREDVILPEATLKLLD